MAKAPVLFHVILQVSDLYKAAEFYTTPLADQGRRIPRGGK
jgi:extradiol dioxygenase family protein